MSAVYIYVIGREQGPVKIGISASLVGRLAILQTGCPFKLTLLHAHEAKNRDHALSHERSFHESYADYRILGEWFKMDSDCAIDGIETRFETEETRFKKARCPA